VPETDSGKKMKPYSVPMAYTYIQIKTAIKN